MRRNSRNRNMRNKKKQDIDYKAARKELSIFIIILLILLILVSIFYFFKNSNLYKNIVETSKQEIENEKRLEDEAKEKEKKENTKEETDTTFTLAAIGDVMCHDTQYIDAYNADTQEYDFSYVFDDIKFYTQTADIAVGSLETSFAGEERGYSNYPTFNTPDNLAYALKDIGIDVLSTAGNHCLDMGFSGLSRTIDVLNDADIAHLGTYKTQEEQDQILFKYVKGVKIAFINYTYGTNGIPVPKDKNFRKKVFELLKSKSLTPIISYTALHSLGDKAKDTELLTLFDMSFLIDNEYKELCKIIELVYHSMIRKKEIKAKSYKSDLEVA